ncbi:ABC transporter permease [Paenibacillus sp. 481]|uniref:ABC transporter permease n=1 Tax=Paenibacillus sp. 481 TaxID=2835869 RepID=UPI001E407105|nr:ABC transporter permease [Paenibacillus sp. 481]UHA72475.1 ABC transporter permease [Paenibacillus sp. 481]
MRWLSVLSIVVGIIIWFAASTIPAVNAIVSDPLTIAKALVSEWEKGYLSQHIFISVWRVIAGFTLALLAALPIAFLIGWYKSVRLLLEPWIQFFRTIPPIALIPLVIVAQGVGEQAKITVIFVSSFLVMVVTIFQGVSNVDMTMIKAARVLGAKDHQLFLEVVVPASFPYILVAMRLGLASAWTTLVAAELTGASRGLGTMIMEASLYFRMDIVVAGILLIGMIGLLMDRALLYVERRLTGWQEVHKS